MLWSGPGLCPVLFEIHDTFGGSRHRDLIWSYRHERVCNFLHSTCSWTLKINFLLFIFVAQSSCCVWLFMHVNFAAYCDCNSRDWLWQEGLEWDSCKWLGLIVERLANGAMSIFSVMLCIYTINLHTVDLTLQPDATFEMNVELLEVKKPQIDSSK